MKLLSIRFKNIHSLKGEHEVRFDQEPLKSTGIFAITGATGSGKSSILDVITLALYNEIPRFDRKISKAEINKLGSVVTHYTDEAWAEVTYQTHKGSYRSRWEISKTNRGTWRDYDMSITDLNTQKSLGIKKSEVPGKNESLIGLNYEQFIKSILLSQGEFARFLKSKKNERSALLEDITGTYIYREIGMQAFELQKLKNTDLQKAQDRLDNIDFLSEEDRLSIESQGQVLSMQVNELTQSLRLLEKQKETKKLQLETQQEENQISKEIAILNNLKSQLADEKIKFSVHQSVLPFEVDIHRHMDITSQIKTSEKEVSQYKAQISRYTQDVDLAIADLSRLTSSTVTQDNFQEEKVKFENHINALDSQLSSIVDKGNDLRQGIEKRLQSGKTVIEDQLIPNIDPAHAIGLIEDRLKTAGIKDHVNTSSLLEDKDRLQSEVNGLIQWNQMLSDIHKLEAEIEESKKNQEEAGEEKDKISEKLKSESGALEQLQKELQVAKEKHSQALQYASLKERRDALEEGEPCPLCGSTEHPYVLHQAYKDATKTGIEYEKTEQRVQSVRRSIQSINNSMTKYNTIIETTQKVLKQKQQDLHAIILRQEECCHQYSFLKGMKSKDTATAIENRKVNMMRLTKRIELQEEVNTLVQLMEMFKTLESLLLDYDRISLRRNAMYIGENIHSDLNVVHKKYTSAIHNLETTGALLEKTAEQFNRNSTILQNLSDQLNKQLQGIGFDNIKSATDALMDKAEAQRIEDKLQDIRRKEISLQTRREELMKRIEKLKRLKVTDHSIERLDESIRQLNHTIQENNKNLGGLQEQIQRDDIQRARHATTQKEIQKMKMANRKYDLLNELIGDAKGSKFSNYAQELTLHRLLAITNQRLSKMNDRYQLEYDSSIEDLQIVDTYHGDARRTVKTLSGGESFVVSLALALSLSDLASRNIQLKSLFIDEGFGTLDQETLDMALSTLEKLQHDSGKTIGIISHVMSLKERIQTQIKVHRNEQGYSVLEVVG